LSRLQALTEMDIRLEQELQAELERDRQEKYQTGNTIIKED